MDILDRLSNGILLFLSLHNFFPGNQQFVYLCTYFAQNDIALLTNLYKIYFYHQKDTLCLLLLFRETFRGLITCHREGPSIRLKYILSYILRDDLPPHHSSASGLTIVSVLSLKAF